MLQWRESVPTTTVAVTLVAAMAITSPRAQADERFTVGAAVAWVAGAAGAGIIGNWAYDSLFGEPKEPECQGDVVVEEGVAMVIEPDGTMKMGAGKKVVLDDDDDDNDFQGVVLSDTVLLPDDYPGLLPLPPTYQMAETATYSLNPATGTVTGELDSMTLYADVSDPAFLGDKTLWSLEREAGFRLLKPLGGPPGETSVITLPISIDSLTLATTDLPDTVAGVEWELVIEVEELGGPVFEARVYIGQGSTPLIQGDIPAGAFTTAPGSASLVNYSQTFSVPVPANLDTLTFKVTQRNEGEAFALQGPEWSTENAHKAGSTGVTKLIGRGDLTPGSSNELEIVGGIPGAYGLLFASDTANPTPFQGGLLVPFPVLLQLGFLMPASGGIVLPFDVDSLGPGVTVVLQYWYEDAGVASGSAASNGLTLITQ